MVHSPYSYGLFVSHHKSFSTNADTIKVQWKGKENVVYTLSEWKFWKKSKNCTKPYFWKTRQLWSE